MTSYRAPIAHLPNVHAMSTRSRPLRAWLAGAFVLTSACTVRDGANDAGVATRKPVRGAGAVASRSTPDSTILDGTAGVRLSETDAVARARQWYEETERSIAGTPADTIPLDGQSREGGYLVIHVRAGDLVRVTSYQHWHRGTDSVRIYYKGATPFFALDVSERYRTPALARGAVDRREDRWYLAGDSVVRWVDAAGTIRDLRSPEVPARVAAIRQSIWRFTTLARLSSPNG